MDLFQKAERHLGRYAIPNLSFWIMIGQVLVYGLALFTNFPTDALYLEPALVLQGEVWRLFTFIFDPPAAHPVFLAFVWYFFYMMGSALEQTWGDFRYNCFIALGLCATAAVAFIFPYATATNAFLMSSVFLAFAFLNPNFEILLFFIIPIRIKWLALFTWVLYGITIVLGTLPSKLSVLAATFNFFVFFGRDLVLSLKGQQRRRRFEAQRKGEAEEAFHRCTICGATDRSHPERSFAYKNGIGFCEEHYDLMDSSEEEQEAARQKFLSEASKR